MSTPLPQRQADRLATLLEAFGDLSISAGERETLTWLAGSSVVVDDIAGMVRWARVRSSVVAVLAAHDKQLSRERARLVALCECAGIDPGDSPLDVLIRHLRGRERTQRPGEQSADPALGADPLVHITVGDPDPTHCRGPEEGCNERRALGGGWCTRLPHPPGWQHIAGNGERVLAVWTVIGPDRAVAR
jgi:hypothetical protein